MATTQTMLAFIPSGLTTGAAIVWVAASDHGDCGILSSGGLIGPIECQVLRYSVLVELMFILPLSSGGLALIY